MKRKIYLGDLVHISYNPANGQYALGKADLSEYFYLSEDVLEAIIIDQSAIKSLKNICHDCLAEPGQLHELGCDMERCPFCGKQLISCGCYDTIMDIGPDMEINDQKWLEILNERGRIPYETSQS